MKSRALGGLLLSLSLWLPPLDAAHVSFKVVGGGGLVSGGDYNVGVKGWNEWFRDFHDRVSGGLEPLDRSLEGEAAVAYELNSIFSAGLAVGLRGMTAEGEASGVTRLLDLTFETRERLLARIQAVPLTVFCSARIPLGERVRLAVEAGIENAWNRLTFESVSESEGFLPSREKYSLSARTQSLGLRAAAGVEIALFRGLAFVAEICGRSVKPGSFTGSYERSGDILGLAFGESGDGHSLWFYQQQIGGKTYTLLAFGPSAPATAAAGSSRQATLGLSGVSLRLGVRYSL